MFPIEEIEKIAELSSLELTAEEKAMFAQQFEDILNYFKVIDSAPEAAPPAATEGASADATSNISRFREDRAVDSGISPREYSPHMEDGHFKVPKVIE